jgi:hypothetical protein
MEGTDTDAVVDASSDSVVFDSLVQFIQRACLPVLVPESLVVEDFLLGPENAERLRRFVVDTSVPVLFVELIPESADSAADSRVSSGA